jgi:hypothetical protein
MAQENKQNKLYFTNVPKNKVSFELNIYNKTTGQSEKAFITGSAKGVAALVKNIVENQYKSATIKDVKLKELENGAKVVESFDFGAKGDAKNYNVEINKVKFKWHTVNKETGEKSQDYVVETFLFAQRDENKHVHWGKTPEAEQAIMRQMEGLVKALENKKSKEVTIGIKFVEGEDGKKRSYVGYVGTPRTPEKEGQNVEKKQSKEPQAEVKKQKPKPADQEIPF